jgi:cytochrome P450
MGASSSSGETPVSQIPFVPGAWPIIGHTPQYLSDPLGFMEKAAAWGPAVKVRLGPIEAILLREPTDIERLVVGENKRLTKDRTTMDLRRIVGQGLVTSEGETWVRHRKLIAPIFHPSSVAALGGTMVDVTVRHAQRLGGGSSRELHADMTRLTADIVTSTLFASDLGDDVERVGPTIEMIVKYYGHGILSLFPFMEHLPLPANKRAKQAMSALDAMVFDIVRRSREKKQPGKDLLSMLLAARDDGGSGFGDQELRDHLMTFFLAGHETTALALTYTFVLLCQHPEVEERLREEFSNVLGDVLPTYADLPRLPYARCVILESMRLYPPVWAIGREALEDITVAGVRIPKGGQMWMLQWINHRDPRFFPDPLQFRPERWQDGLERTIPKFAYYPFGGGPRICIGNHFAMMEAILAMVTLMQRLRFRLLEPHAPLELLAGITLRPKHPIPVAYESIQRNRV